MVTALTCTMLRPGTTCRTSTPTRTSFALPGFTLRRNLWLSCNTLPVKVPCQDSCIQAAHNQAATIDNTLQLQYNYNMSSLYAQTAFEAGMMERYDLHRCCVCCFASGYIPCARQSVM